jgi:hypothetical protein
LADHYQLAVSKRPGTMPRHTTENSPPVLGLTAWFLTGCVRYHGPFSTSFIARASGSSQTPFFVHALSAQAFVSYFYQARPGHGENVKVITMAMAFMIMLSSSFANAKKVRHKPSIRTYGLQRAVPPVRSGSSHPNYGNPARVSSGGYLWNGRSAAEAGGEMLFNQ